MMTAEEKEFLEGIGNDLVNELVGVAPVDTGFLRESIGYEIKGDRLLINMPDYALFLEYGTYDFRGTKDGKGSLKMPKRKFQMTPEERAKLPKGMEPYPFIRNTVYHKLKEIIKKNAEIHLGTDEVDVNFR